MKRASCDRPFAIAIDQEEFISIFQNGRGQAAQSPIPPGIFGYVEGRAGINPAMYEWDVATAKPKRRSIEVARQLLAEAGWPNGRSARSGEPLVINLDTTATGVGSKSRIDWLNKQFQKIDVQLVVRSTDYNRFQEKVRKGAVQLFYFGWNADYPDPENFLFLLYGPQGKVKHAGENAANYANAEYDRLFDEMRAMENGPRRQAIIDRMLDHPALRRAVDLGFPSQGLHIAPCLAHQPQAVQGWPQYAQVPARRCRPSRAIARGVESSRAVAATGGGAVARGPRCAGHRRPSSARAGDRVRCQARTQDRLSAKSRRWWHGDPGNSTDEMRMAQKILRHFYAPSAMEIGFFYSFNVRVQRRCAASSRSAFLERSVSRLVGPRAATPR